MVFIKFIIFENPKKRILILPCYKDEDKIKKYVKMWEWYPKIEFYSINGLFRPIPKDMELICVSNTVLGSNSISKNIDPFNIAHPKKINCTNFLIFKKNSKDIKKLDKINIYYDEKNNYLKLEPKTELEKKNVFSMYIIKSKKFNENLNIIFKNNFVKKYIVKSKKNEKNLILNLSQKLQNNNNINIFNKILIIIICFLILKKIFNTK